MSGLLPRIAAVVVTAALLAGTAPAVSVSAPSVNQRTDAAQAAEPDWMRALRIRSEALNRIHGLAPMHALQIRGEALNRIHGLDGASVGPRPREHLGRRPVTATRGPRR